jgi:orotate phosphoribosyltransferase
MATENLIRELLEAGCLKFGQFTLKSGAKSEYYIDFRESSLHRKLFDLIVKGLIDRISKIIAGSTPLDKVVIAGIPYGVVPIASVVADRMGCCYAPLRKEVKAHGYTSNMEYLKDHRFILIEDVMSSGSSIMETIEKLDGKNITDVVVIANREAGGEESITSTYPNIKVHSVLRASYVSTRQFSFEVLCQAWSNV